ncbi:BCCT family transporter [Halorubrum vacuolatum]|uniref:Choline/glycine/proline betaine transport protein n=1 Tax=Halorubrum vacuolatum TaxID=63740 RepID=A0A238WZP8_HALVU|nr:BCCT family transporter [Halorubrum vacuolatum]SNR52125.1 choline/glycine/proline betaine transport protein [Halorubrum vacuolatum]
MTDKDGGIQAELFHADTDHEAGGNNIQKFGFDINPPVFFIASGLILLFIVLSLAFPDQAGTAYGDAREWVSEMFDWLFILAANAFIVFMVGLAISKYGSIRLGGVDGEQEFSDISWIAMLFSAGMGIGLMFFGVAEPVFHFYDPHLGATGGSEGAVDVALAVSLFHWGFHPWAIYALVALGLGFFSYNRGLPLTFRSVFWPVLGERIYGWPGHIIDILTIFATLFGLVTSLGLGALQINRGLEFLGGSIGFFPAVPFSGGVQVGIVLFITLLATGSVYLGLEKGIRRLSNLNLSLMLLLLGAVFVLGPTLTILGMIPQGIGAYLGNFFELSFFAGQGDAFSGSPSYAGAGDAFLVDWTVFYWAWWISWSPFVGMFIARISKGRTIREFIGGVMLIPVMFSFAWFGAMGGSALSMERGGETVGTLGGVGEFYDADGELTGAWEELWAGPISEEIWALAFAEDTAMFAMFNELPGTEILSILAIILVTTFFVTSTDSGSLVLEHLSTGGKHTTGATGRVFWAVAEGAVAIAILLAAGADALAGLQAAAIVTGLPFAFILIFMMFSVYQGLRKEYRILNSDRFQERIDEMVDSGDIVVESDRGQVITEVSRTDDGSTVSETDD